MLTNNFELIDLLHKTIWWILDLIFALKYVMRWSFIILLFHNTWTFQKKIIIIIHGFYVCGSHTLWEIVRGLVS